LGNVKRATEVNQKAHCISRLAKGGIHNILRMVQDCNYIVSYFPFMLFYLFPQSRSSWELRRIKIMLLGKLEKPDIIGSEPNEPANTFAYENCEL